MGPGEAESTHSAPASSQCPAETGLCQALRGPNLSSDPLELLFSGLEDFQGKWEFGKARAAPSLAAGSRQAERDWLLPGGAAL